MSTKKNVNIAAEFPRSWAELNTYYNGYLKDDAVPALNIMLQLPFAFMVGIWIDFLNENGVDLDVQSLNLELIEQSVYESLQILENTISHFS